MDLLDEDAKRAWQDQDPALSYEVDWTSLEEQLCFAENHGINEKVASYIGATTLRASCRCLRGPALTAPEIDVVRGLVRPPVGCEAAEAVKTTLLA